MNYHSGCLTLVPTPIDESNPLEGVAQQRLLDALHEPQKNLILVEELKAARRRWIRWGLPKAAIDQFVLYNEHTSASLTGELVGELKKGKNLFLMSDAGLPAFCDPGQVLVDTCHRSGIRVTATPFPNSVALAVALSGFPSNHFYFEGFLPRKESERRQRIAQVLKNRDPIVFMDTPYRLGALLGAIQEGLLESPFRDRIAFFAFDLNQSSEELVRLSLEQVIEKLGPDFPKREFVLVVGPGGFK